MRTVRATAAMAAVFIATVAQAADAERGRMLYELRCGQCHTESVHGRAQRDAKNFGEVLAYVSRWNSQLGIGWRKEDIEDVTRFVNDTYYGFKCEGPAC